MKCPICRASRDAFADGMAWILHVQNCVLITRREQGGHWRSHQKQTPLGGPRFRSRHHRRYWRHRAHELERGRQYYQAHREEKLARFRALRAADLPRWRERGRGYYQKHRARHIAYDLQRRRADPAWVPQAVRAAQARELDSVVVRLRREGKTFREIAESIGRPLGTCMSAYRRAALGTLRRDTSRPAKPYKASAGRVARQMVTLAFEHEVAQLRNEGYMLAQISERFGKRLGAVKNASSWKAHKRSPGLCPCEHPATMTDRAAG